MAVKIQIDVFWVVMPCSIVAKYQGPWRWRQQGPPKCW